MLLGRRGHNPFHGDAGRKVSSGAVYDHWRARTALQRPWTKRIPRYRDRHTTHVLCGARVGRSFPGQTSIGEKEERMNRYHMLLGSAAREPQAAPGWQISRFLPASGLFGANGMQFGP